MTQFTDDWVVPWLALLCEWSVRWGVLLALVATWFAVHPPRRAGARHVLCWATLVAGLLIPLAPRWGGLPVPWWRPVAPEESKATFHAVSLAQPQHVPSAQAARSAAGFDPPRTESRAVESRAYSIPLSGFQLAALTIGFGVGIRRRDLAHPSGRRLADAGEIEPRGCGDRRGFRCRVP